MSTPDPTGNSPVPSGSANGWGQPPAGDPGYDAPPPPRYGQYAPTPPSGSAAPPPPQGAAPTTGNGSYGAPQYGQGAYGQGHYGQGQYGTPSAPPAAGAFGPAPGPYVDPSAKPGIVPLRPLSLGEVFDGAFGAIRHNPRLMLGLPAIVITVATGLGFLLGYIVSGYLVPAMPSELITDEYFTGGVAMLSSSLGMLAILNLAAPVVNGLLIGSIGQSVIGRRITARDLWRQVRPRVWPLIAFSLLVGLAGLAVVTVYVLIVWGAIETSAGLGVAVSLLGGLGLVVLYVWFLVRTLLIPPALVLEGQGLWPAVGRGWRLSRGSFWRLFGIYLLASIAVSIISSILTVPFSFLGGFALEAGNFELYTAVTAFGSILTGVLSAAFTAGVICLLYIDVRMRREGLDVELAAAASVADRA